MATKSNTLATIQMIGFSLIGIMMFFVPFEINGKSTIAFDHAATYLVSQQRPMAVILLFMLMIYGVVNPFLTGSWRKNLTMKVLTIFKIIGLVLATLYIAN